MKLGSLRYVAVILSAVAACGCATVNFAGKSPHCEADYDNCMKGCVGYQNSSQPDGSNAGPWGCRTRCYRIAEACP